ncbi:MAG: ABC transporter permease [Gemmatimonadetes bacterium]|uniref:ABC transporter permease n=1 Tax=Candidatus Kutchimonas denitrificans TaxID=3056748 RepID=A0AAE5CC22_9BACT|nr:ABC transporter permease [Gemmatimonadota bacterium]NIR76577.1 ABC transporter permease [Candidatus Kutchimonas denitrificans]NIS01133.1 ABC transporter permease [Gemmatimonadota bacterium]NIT66900.1 ABC transporter permease [Gemmatimonadota bacterium]NIU54673.1 FtsX-like permease family protein [Gemmatimonadota bacterium]
MKRKRIFRWPFRDRARIADDVKAEVEHHLELSARKLERRGMDGEAARREARRRFGDVDRAKRELETMDQRNERRRERRAWLKSLYGDLRYGVRRLVRERGFATTALLTLALGIGASTAIFSVVRTVLLEPLPYATPDRLVMIWEQRPEEGGTTWLSAREVMSYAQQAESFEQIAGIDLRNANLTGGLEPERVRAAAVTASAFEALGVQALLGRTLIPANDEPGASDAVVIGHGLWQRAFGGAADVVGQTLRVNGRPRTVVGVMPASFRLPLDYREERPTELWLPLALDPADPGQWGDRYLNGLGRLREGVSPARARAELARIAEGWIREGFVADQGDGRLFRNAVPLREFVTGGVRRPLLIVFGAVGFVLLIVCANVANLLLARADGRRREVAIRGAMGAARRRLMGQLLTENLVLSTLGSGLGVGVAYAGTRALAALHPPGLPRVESVGIDPAVLVFSAGLALLTGLVFGLVPALQLSRTDLVGALREGGDRGTAGREGRRFRRGLVVAEMAFSVILLVGAGLLLRSFVELRRIDLGFEPDRVLTLRLSPSLADYPEDAQVVAFYRQAVDGIEALPGVVSAAAVRVLPLSSTIGNWSITIEGRPHVREENPNGDWQVVTSGYFETMGLELVSGRFLTDADREDGPMSVVINAPMAARYWPGEEALGKRFHLSTDDRPWMTVVGVVRPVRHNAVVEEPRTEMYLPHAQMPAEVGFAPYGMTLLVKTEGDPMAMVGPVREVIRGLDPNLPVSDIRSMDDVVANALAQPRFTALLLGLFAALALLLAAIGIYGTISLHVSRRAHEIGIRMALGAQRGQVLGMILGQGMVLAVAGVAFGLLGAFFLTRTLGALVYEVDTLDPVTFAAVPVMLIMVALLACLNPARRAARLEPAATLRRE